MTDTELDGAFGSYLQKTREAKSLSLSALARKSGVTRQALAAIERSERDARLSTLIKVAAALDTSLLELLDGWHRWSGAELTLPGMLADLHRACERLRDYAERMGEPMHEGAGP